VEPKTRNQFMDIEFIGTDQHLLRWQLFGVPPHVGQALDPLGIVIFGHQLRPFPHPAHLIQPPAHGPGGDLQPMLDLAFPRQRGTTPTGATAAIRSRRCLEQHRQRALEPRAQDGRPNRGCDLAVLVNTQAQLPRAVEVNNAVGLLVDSRVLFSQVRLKRSTDSSGP